MAYLLQFDSVHGTWAHSCAADASAVVLSRKGGGEALRIPYCAVATPAGLAVAYRSLGVQVVLECTGEFLTCACGAGGASQPRCLFSCALRVIRRTALAPYFDAAC